MTARKRRRSLLSTVHGKEPATIRPAVDGGKQRRISADHGAQFGGRRGRRARQQNVRHVHPLEIGTMLGRRRSDQLAAVVALEIERNRPATAVEPDERLVVGRNDRRVWQVVYDREELSKVGRDGAGLCIPPPALEALKFIVEVTAGDQGAK